MWMKDARGAALSSRWTMIIEEKSSFTSGHGIKTADESRHHSRIQEPFAIQACPGPLTVRTQGAVPHDVLI